MAKGFTEKETFHGQEIKKVLRLPDVSITDPRRKVMILNYGSMHENDLLKCYMFTPEEKRVILAFDEIKFSPVHVLPMKCIREIAIIYKLSRYLECGTNRLVLNGVSGGPSLSIKDLAVLSDDRFSKQSIPYKRFIKWNIIKEVGSKEIENIPSGWYLNPMYVYRGHTILSKILQMFEVDEVDGIFTSKHVINLN